MKTFSYVLILISISIFSLTGCIGIGKKELIKVIKINQSNRKIMASLDSAEIVNIRNDLNALIILKKSQKELEIVNEIMETDSLIQLDSIELRMVRNRFDSLNNEIRLSDHKLIQVKKKLWVMEELHYELKLEKRIQQDFQNRKDRFEKKRAEALDRMQKYEMQKKLALKESQEAKNKMIKAMNKKKKLEMSRDSALKEMKKIQKLMEEFELQNEDAENNK